MRSSTTVLAEIYGQCMVHYSAIHFHVALQDTFVSNNSVQLKIGGACLVFYLFGKKY